MVVCRFVAAYGLPVKGLGCVFRNPITFNDLGITAFRLGPVFLHERHAAQAHRQKGAEIFFRQIALEPPSFLAVGVHYEYGRRPYRFETVKILRIFLDVDFERDKIFVDE